MSNYNPRLYKQLRMYSSLEVSHTSPVLGLMKSLTLLSSNWVSEIISSIIGVTDHMYIVHCILYRLENQITSLLIDQSINQCQDSSKCWPITPLKMASDSTIVEKESFLRSLGWGQYDENGQQSQFLKQVDLRFHSAYPNCPCPDFYVLRTMVGKEGQDTCKGDSGELVMTVTMWMM